jgi:hypothetical protein
MTTTQLPKLESVATVVRNRQSATGQLFEERRHLSRSRTLSPGGSLSSVNGVARRLGSPHHPIPQTGEGDGALGNPPSVTDRPVWAGVRFPRSARIAGDVWADTHHVLAGRIHVVPASLARTRAGISSGVRCRPLGEELPPAFGGDAGSNPLSTLPQQDPVKRLSHPPGSVHQQWSVPRGVEVPSG